MNDGQSWTTSISAKTLDAVCAASSHAAPTHALPIPGYRAGSVNLAECFKVDYLESLLPPDHRIAATQLVRTQGQTRCLIEGATLPLACGGDSDEPQEVKLIVTVTNNDGDGAQRLDGHWAHNTAPGTGIPLETWYIGTWPSYAAFAAEQQSRFLKQPTDS